MITTKDMTMWSTSVLLQLNCTSQPSSQESPLSCSLQWRQGHLWVRQSQQTQPDKTLMFLNQSRLVTCLCYSSTTLICLDARLEAPTLQFWVDVCEKAEKQVFLRFDVKQRSLKSLSWFNKLSQAVNCLGAIFLLAALSPVLASIVLLMNFSSSEPIFRKEWRIGARGKLFQAFQFETHRRVKKVNAVPFPFKTDAIGEWLLQSQLYQLPQLFNVLKGEMALVGYGGWKLTEIDPLSQKEFQQVNAPPGMLGELKRGLKSTSIDFSSSISK